MAFGWRIVGESADEPGIVGGSGRGGAKAQVGERPPSREVGVEGGTVVHNLHDVGERFALSLWLRARSGRSRWIGRHSLGPYELYGDVGLEGEVPRCPDNAHAALPQRPEQAQLAGDDGVRAKLHGGGECNTGRRGRLEQSGRSRWLVQRAAASRPSSKTTLSLKKIALCAAHLHSNIRQRVDSWIWKDRTERLQDTQ